MKLLLLLLVTSCALPLRTLTPKKEIRAVDKLHKCVIELVRDHSIKAVTAEEVCSKIFRKGD